MAEKSHNLDQSTLLNLNDGAETVHCNKKRKKIAKNNLQCPEPKEQCKYRANCVIYAFGQFEKFDR